MRRLSPLIGLAVLAIGSVSMYRADESTAADLGIVPDTPANDAPNFGATNIAGHVRPLHQKMDIDFDRGAEPDTPLRLNDNRKVGNLDHRRRVDFKQYDTMQVHDSAGRDYYGDHRHRGVARSLAA